MNIDMRTILLSHSISDTVITLILYFAWKQNKGRFEGMSDWVMCFALQSVGITMILMRGFIPDFLSIVVGNVLLIAGAVKFYFGTAVFIDRKINKNFYYGMLGVFTLIYAYFGLVEPKLIVRGIVFSLAIAFISINGARTLYKSDDVKMKRNYRLTGTLMFFVSMLYLMMAWYYKIGITSTNYLNVGFVMSLMTIISQMLLICITFSILVMINSRLVLNLEEESKKKEKILEECTYQATVDGLTKLLNRKTIEWKLREEVDRSQRNNGKMSVILLDVDHFKNINDNFGHPKGDLVLEKISEILKNTLRKTDFIGRWGGEEFIVVCIETEQRAVWKVAEKLRKAVGQYKFDLNTQVTISLGTATLARGESVEDILKRADDNMYMAKKEGRNRTRPDISSEEKFYKNTEND
ncbi:GGDEF domain-containing protein, partial [Ilyobacter sp.]|uniref:GGDEF domain-containing protein n=1 Tax=Ilyobacter sp. TaxID=3100343 RepID=UPI003567AA10